MPVDLRDGRVARIYLVAIVDPPGVVTQIRVEQRDWMDRLQTRAQLSPLTGGGHDQVMSVSVDLWLQLVGDALSTLAAQPE